MQSQRGPKVEHEEKQTETRPSRGGDDVLPDKGDARADTETLAHSTQDPDAAPIAGKQPEDQSSPIFGHSCSTGSDEEPLDDTPARSTHAGVRHITGVNTVKPPHFSSTNDHVLRESK